MRVSQGDLSGRLNDVRGNGRRERGDGNWGGYGLRAGGHRLQGDAGSGHSEAIDISKVTASQSFPPLRIMPERWLQDGNRAGKSARLRDFTRGLGLEF